MIPYDERTAPKFLSPQPREKRPDAQSLESPGWPYKYRVVRDLSGSTTSVEWEGESRWKIGKQHYLSIDKTFYQTDDVHPANSKFRGETVRTIKLKDRTLELKTLIFLHSDENNFYAKFTRQIYEGKKLIRERSWEETIPREFH
jgi:hypothetical protein